MKRYILQAVFMGCTFLVNAQVNLVINPSFEDTIHNVSGAWRLENMVPPWFTVQTTPDYFSKYYSIALGVPSNGWSYQEPRTGDAYIGEFVFNDDLGCYEYFGGKLSEPLQNSKRYCVTFYVNFAFKSSTFPIDGFGIYFSEDSIVIPVGDCYEPLPYDPVVENASGNIVYDTVGWEAITGEFIANGGEQFFIIGNFKSVTETQIDHSFNPNGTNAYYYFDDISVWFCDTDTTNSGNNLEQSPEHGPLQAIAEPISVPNLLSPYTNSSWQIINLPNETETTIYNTLGEVVFYRKRYENDLNISTLPAAMYYYVLRFNDGQKLKGKVVIIK